MLRNFSEVEKEIIFYKEKLKDLKKEKEEIINSYAKLKKGDKVTNKGKYYVLEVFNDRKRCWLGYRILGRRTLALSATNIYHPVKVSRVEYNEYDVAKEVKSGKSLVD